MKKVLKYQLSDLKTSIIVFYGIYYVMIYIAYFMFFKASPGGTFYNGADFSSMIFNFVIGIAIFKEHFWMVCQNGVSRKTFFKSSICCMLSITAFMAFITQISVLITQKNTFTFIKNIYPAFHTSIAFEFVVNILFFMSLYTLCFMSGYFTAILYCLSGKIIKIVIISGLPILIFFLFPISLNFFAEFWKPVINVFLIITGLKSGNPLLAILTLFIVTCILSLISYPLARRVEVK